MTEDEIVQKFVLAGKVPTKYSVQEVLGFSAQTLVRRGFTMRKIKDLYLNLTKVDKHCYQCGTSLLNKTNKYCSHSCSAKANNHKRTKKLKTVTVGVKSGNFTIKKVVDNRKCICCGVNLSNSRSKYCSGKCQQKFQYDVFIETWLAGGDVKLTKGSTVSDRIRRYLFEKHLCKCSRCGWGEINPATSKIPLEVEHIDGNSENNSPENLTLLCPNCHSLTPTYKALNKGNGRHKRRQRYKDGKSY